MEEQKDAKVNYTIQLKNIGPHSNTILERRDQSGIKAVIYADNGAGKSFISKAFKRVFDAEQLNDSEKEKQLLIEKSNAMISFGENEGELLFAVSGNNSPKKVLRVKFDKNALPVIENNTPLIFHVFNSEYVKENLEAVRYKPEDKVSGFILGKANIDLTAEKKQLELLENQKRNILLSINNVISESLKNLRKLSIQTNTTEYKKITEETILSRKKHDNVDSFDCLEEQYNKLNSMPEDIDDIELMVDLIDETTIKEVLSISEMLKTNYTLSSFGEEFKCKVKEKADFIIKGVSLSNNEICPFCEQIYSDSALALVDMYNQFLQDSEAKAINQIVNYENYINNKTSTIKSDIVLKHLEIEKKYEEIRSYVPSFGKKTLNKIDIELSVQNLEKILVCLNNKKDDISKDYNATEFVDELQQMSKTLGRIVEDNNRLIKDLNKAKNKSKKERLMLRKSLCNAMNNLIIDRCETDILLLETIEKNIEKLANEIGEKENTIRINKRKQLVIKLKSHLHFFFGDKYEFDEDNFCVKYKDNNLIDNADYVLSDGEKSILAFCFYLANIHAIVNKESDYSKLLFIIDDPVSSMDFNYVYNVAQAIRNLKRVENLNRFRLIVLTHNIEFMSILVQNKIVAHKYLLSNGVFKDYKEGYILPYEAHLSDLVNVANRTIQPSHTTANSFRHILETIYRFEGSVGENIESYVHDIPEFEGSTFVYSLIQDMSHGGIRSQAGYTDEMLISACKDLIKFIDRKYNGQIKRVEHLG